MTAPRDPDQYRRRLRARVRQDALWRPSEPSQLELFAVQGEPQHISAVLGRYFTQVAGTAA